MHPVHRFVHHRPRLAIAVAIGIATAFLVPTQWQPITRVLTAWNAGVWSYLVSIAWLIMRSTHVRVREIAEQEDQAAVVVLALLSIAAIFSLAAIVMVLATSKDLSVNDRLGHYAFTGITILGSWLFVGMLFTFHYAHMFYRSATDQRPLVFPEKEHYPDYWDFLYFSFTIAVAAQTSDVIVMSRSMRKVVLAQSILSFLFNAAILGMSINIAASVLGT